MAESPALRRLTQLLARLPGLGPRSARRAVIHLLQNREQLLTPLIHELKETAQNLKECALCGNMDLTSPCSLCADPGRDSHTLCVVETLADLWALVGNRSYKGHFHILGGTLSALDGVGPKDLRIPQLIERIRHNHVQEVILALNATLEGQTTAHFIADHLKDLQVRITALAHGVPVGGELDYLDEGTLTTALQARRPIDS